MHAAPSLVGAGAHVVRAIEVDFACVLALGIVPLPFDSHVAAGQPLAANARIDSREGEILWLLGVLDDRAESDHVRARVPESIARLLGDAPDVHWLRAPVAEALCSRIERNSDEAPLVRIGCVIALGTLTDALQRSTSIALALLDDADVALQLTGWLRNAPNLATRASAAVALGWIADARASDALLAVVGDAGSAAFARALAIRALGRIADSQTLSWNNPLSIDVNFMAGMPTWSAPESGTGVFDML